MNNIGFLKNNAKFSRLGCVQILSCFALAGLLLPGLVMAGELIVVVDNIRSAQGNVRAALFNQGKGFPKHPLAGQFSKAVAGSVSISFKDVPPGIYAVSAFHDLDDNLKLDRNFVGKPTEPYGFSRDARGLFGPPSFDEAAIELDDAVKSITVHVK